MFPSLFCIYSGSTRKSACLPQPRTRGCINTWENDFSLVRRSFSPAALFSYRSRVPSSTRAPSCGAKNHAQSLAYNKPSGLKTAPYILSLMFQISINAEDLCAYIHIYICHILLPWRLKVKLRIANVVIIEILYFYINNLMNFFPNEILSWRYFVSWTVAIKDGSCHRSSTKSGSFAPPVKLPTHAANC